MEPLQTDTLYLAATRPALFMGVPLALGAVLLHAGKRGEAREAFARAASDARDPALRALAASFEDQAR